MWLDHDFGNCVVIASSGKKHLSLYAPLLLFPPSLSLLMSLFLSLFLSMYLGSRLRCVLERLGDYEAHHFSDSRVQDPLAKFQQAIEAIETDMVAE